MRSTQMYLLAFLLAGLVFLSLLGPRWVYSEVAGGVWPSVLTGIGQWKDARSVAGPPKEGLLKFARPAIDSIGLSVDDYASVETYWQGVFYSDPSTPLTVLVSTIQADENVNSTTVYSTDRGTAVYADGTSAATLTRVASWFGVASGSSLADRYLNVDHYTNTEHYL